MFNEHHSHSRIQICGHPPSSLNMCMSKMMIEETEALKAASICLRTNYEELWKDAELTGPPYLQQLALSHEKTDLMLGAGSFECSVTTGIHSHTFRVNS